MNTRLLIFVIISLFLNACAQPFSRPQVDYSQSGTDLFNKTFIAHGGEELSSLHALDASIDGEWKYLITRIQPLVTDHKFRVQSQESVFPNEGKYMASYQGPAGKKQVVRTRESIQVHYNDEENLNEDVLASSALTADAFYYFLLGPLSLASYSNNFIQLEDRSEKGKRYHRLYLELKPGLGFSERDELVLWIDSETFLTYRMVVTLEGYSTTKGAHVDVSYRDYKKIENYIFPSVFFERVLAPIKIDAHAWWVEDMSIRTTNTK